MHGFWAGKRRNSSPYRKWHEVHRPQQGVRGLRSPELSIQGNKKNIMAVLILRGITRAYRKAGYLTMVIAGYIPANSQLAAAIATIVKSLSIGK